MKRKTFVLLTCLALIAAVTGCQPQEDSAPLSATLSELTGLVQLKQNADGEFAPAAPDSKLDVNGQVQTGDDGRVRLDLSSGTIIRIAPSSIFTLTSNDETQGGLITRIQLTAGKIFIILNGGQADVETPSGVASVRGSYMKVEVDPVTKTIYITCLEGDCSASNPAGAVNFTNGQSVVLFAQDEQGNWTVPSVGQMTPEEFQEWLDENPEAQEFYEQGIAALTALAPTEEATEEPTEVPTDEPTEVPTEVNSAVPPAGASNACSVLQEPANGSGLGKIGNTTFAWSKQPGATSYVVTFINQNGVRVRVGSTTNSAAFYIEILGAGGTYEWFVTAYDEGGNEICTSTASTFSKPQGDPTPKPKPEQDPNDLEESPSEPYCDPCDYLSSCYDPFYYLCSGY